MNVRDEDPADHGPIRDLIEQAFGRESEAVLVDALRRDGDIVGALVAEQDGRIVGHAVLSRLISPGGSLALGPVSVSPGRQRQGVGTALIRTCVEQAGMAEWEAIFVLGDPDYYERFGFRAETAIGFETPYPVQYFMALELKKGSLLARCGAVEYPQAFAALPPD